MNHEWVVGVDLGATKIAFGLIDPADKIVARRRIATNADAGAASVVTRIAQEVAQLQARLPAGAHIGALGICAPGPVDHKKGVLVDPPNLPNLHHTPLREMLESSLQAHLSASPSSPRGIPVCLEHDAKAAALGEFHYGSGRGQQSMVYIVVGTGVGAAVVLDGRLYRGSHNAAGEVGHITLDPDGELCSCGCRGCVETFLGGPWIARRYRRALEQVAGTSAASHISCEMVAARAQAGDPLAVKVLTEAGRALGVAVATLAMVLDVDFFVVGSSVAKAGDFLLEPARTTMPKCCYQSVSCRVQIVSTELQDDGPILGSGWQARQRLGGFPNDD